MCSLHGVHDVWYCVTFLICPSHPRDKIEGHLIHIPPVSLTPLAPYKMYHMHNVTGQLTLIIDFPLGLSVQHKRPND